MLDVRRRIERGRRERGDIMRRVRHRPPADRAPAEVREVILRVLEYAMRRGEYTAAYNIIDTYDAFELRGLGALKNTSADEARVLEGFTLGAHVAWETFAGEALLAGPDGIHQLVEGHRNMVRG